MSSFLPKMLPCKILDNSILQAKMVAAATHSMCEAANTMVQGNASEEKLIASAKEVAASTAALLVACRVKADPGSQAMQRLQVTSSFSLLVVYLKLLIKGAL